MTQAIRVATANIEAALDEVREVVVRTPTIRFDSGAGHEVALKLENLQRLGAFKIRGAWNRMSHLTPEERHRGVTTVSSGNHGLAVAWSARRLGLPCLVRVPEGASGRKVEAIRGTGAELSYLSREHLVRAHWEEGWRAWPETYIPPFADPAIIAGQGTVGWELAEDAPDVRSVLVPVGGGGLVSGIAIAVKHLLPKARVFGVQAEGAAPLPAVLKTNQASRVDRPRTIADGIQIGLILPTMVDILVRSLDGCLVVSDDDIRLAMRRLALEARIVAEPAGAAAFAACQRYGGTLEGPVAVVISGGNVTPEALAGVLG
ncbi:MAG TPA: threonine/serine dehydratase [Thermoplasmata archaeon]|nr:threonine/serine dehydratase [Thermoplasmata archaeon]